jgi:hypothetical protein
MSRSEPFRQGDLFALTAASASFDASKDGSAPVQEVAPPLNALLPSQSRALNFIETALRSPMPFVVLQGAERSGKTLILTHLQQRVENECFCARNEDSARAMLVALAQGRTVFLDEAELIGMPSAVDAHTVWAAATMVATEGGKLLLAGSGSPLDWAKGVVDLQSRLRAAPCVCLPEPSEVEFVVVIDAHLRRQFLRLDAGLLEVAGLHLERRWKAAELFANALVAALGQQEGGSLERLVRQLIEQINQQGVDANPVNTLPLQLNLL